jgi:Zn-dependent protease
MSDDGRKTEMPHPGDRQFGVIRLGRIAGVEVRLHWTWAIAASLIALALGSSVFPSAVPGLSTNAYYTLGVATALLFFVSLLLHELGHALQAHREGIPTRGITLWMLGGIAESDAPFPTAGTEARVALAGPAVSAVIGAGLVAAGQIGGLPQTVAAMVQWLGWTNLVLLAFNLLPALPLDGGRVLRAALWRVYRDHMRATRDALRVSQALAVAMVAFGVVWSIGGAGLNGLWLAFIGVFLMSSGRGERALAEMQVALAGLRVGDVMSPVPITPRPSAGAAELVTDGVVLDADAGACSALPVLAASPSHRAAVVRGGVLVGTVTLGDLVRAADRRAQAPPGPAGAHLNDPATGL